MYGRGFQLNLKEWGEGLAQIEEIQRVLICLSETQVFLIYLCMAEIIHSIGQMALVKTDSKEF